MRQGHSRCATNAVYRTYSARRAVEILLHQWRLVEGQPFLVEARERPVEEKSPLPLPVEGAGTGPISAERYVIRMVDVKRLVHLVALCRSKEFFKKPYR